MLLHHLHRGEGPPAVLLHGLFGSAANLGMVARGLVENFSVYSLDLPNHGLSPRREHMTYRDMAADVAAFIREQDLAPCHLLGHSMGGKIAMQLALDSPQLVNRLVVADIAPVQYPPHHDQVLAGLDAVADARPTDRKSADAVLSSHVEDAGVRAFLLKSWQKSKCGEWEWLINREAIKANYPHLGEPNQLPGSGENYPGEVMFIIGSESDYVRPEHREAVLALFPRAQVKVIQGTGHWLHAEKPAAFNKLALRFFAEGN
jgi:esterase